MAICYDKLDLEDKDAKKIASKGISRTTNNFLYDQYKQALYEEETFEATNYSIRAKKNSICTTVSRKRGLTGTHIKNFVHPDRISITPHKRHRSNNE